MVTTSEYVYLPEYDGGWSVMGRDEYATTGGADAYGPAEPVELTFNLEGWRGHYLAADFVTEAAFLLEDVELNVQQRATVADADGLAVQYRRHNELSSDQQCPEGCDCEWIGEVCSSVEEILGQVGYVTEWGDGVAVFKRLS